MGRFDDDYDDELDGSDDGPDLDDERSAHDRGVCDGHGMCDDCDNGAAFAARMEARRDRPGHGSRATRRRLQRQRNMQQGRRGRSADDIPF